MREIIFNLCLKVKINKLQDDLFTCKTSKQKCMIDLQKSQSTLSNSRGFTENVTQRANLNKIYNPLVSPGRAYVYKNDSFQQLGFIFNDSFINNLFVSFDFPAKSLGVGNIVLS